MNSEWPRVRLGDHVDSCLGKMLDKKKNKGKEQPYLGNSNVRWGEFDLSALAQMKFEEGESERYGLSYGDLIICEGGEPGRCAIWKSELPDMKIQKALHRVRPKSSLNNYFLYYWFLHAGKRGLLEPYFTGTTIKHLTGKVLNNLEIPLPPLSHQKFVARILGELDEKIQLNQKVNQTLEQMAQAIFKSWFVDFEPVKAKMAAKESWQALQAEGEVESLPDLETCMNLAAMQVISGQTEEALNQMADQQPEQFSELFKTAALFPAAMQDSELGEIPEGWEATTLGAEFDITMGQSPPGDTYNEVGEGVAFFQGRRDFGVRFPKNRVYCSAPKRMAKASDTLLSVRAPVGDVNIAGSSCCIGRGLAALRHKSGCSSFTYYSALELGSQLASYDSEGTVFGSINQKNLNALDFKKPLPSLVKCFSNYAKSLDEKIFTLSLQIQSLEAVRDTLLPKLLSGELSVADLELVGEA